MTHLRFLKKVMFVRRENVAILALLTFTLAHVSFAALAPFGLSQIVPEYNSLLGGIVGGLFTI